MLLNRFNNIFLRVVKDIFCCSANLLLRKENWEVQHKKEGKKKKKGKIKEKHKCQVALLVFFLIIFK
jgi:predicted metal-dependent hydrolase